MCSTQDDAALPAPGFPIRRSTGQRLFSASPWLIAAVHVLLRLLVPRHPPHALSILTVISLRAVFTVRSQITRWFWPSVQFSRSGERRLNAATRPRRSLKTKQHAGPRASSKLGRHFRTPASSRSSRRRYPRRPSFAAKQNSTVYRAP
jgi:hypothetical protein